MAARLRATDITNLGINDVSSCSMSVARVGVTNDASVSEVHIISLFLIFLFSLSQDPFLKAAHVARFRNMVFQKDLNFLWL